ncbi:hypothetical protein QFZ48_000121 [Chitinophaga sp. W2I13]
MKRYPICLLLIALLAACQGPEVQEKSGYKTRLQFGSR